VSAYVAKALDEYGKAHDLRALVDELLDASGGPMTAAEHREAEERLGLRKRTRRRSA
jgi:hypothetical protein